MRIIQPIVAALSILHSWSSIAVEADPLKRINALGRQLQVVQDRSVKSQDDERRIVDEKLKLLGNELASAPRELLGDPGVRSVILLYILSGGDTRALRVDIQKLDIGSRSGRLLRGALAYAEGRVSEARRLLAAINPLDESSVVGAHLALAQAALAVDEDETVRIDKFAVSRLLLPGSIAEETALRRSVDAAMSVQRYNDAMFFIKQYRRRFSGSIYGPKFQGLQTKHLLKIVTDGSDKDSGHACRLLREAGNDGRVENIVSVTKVGMLGDVTKLSRVGKCLSDIAVSNREKALANLFSRAAKVLESEDNGQLKTSDIGAGDLTQEEQALLLSIEYASSVTRHKKMKEDRQEAERPEGVRDANDDVIDLAKASLQNARR